MKTTVTVQAFGTDLQAVIADAGPKLDAFFGGHGWRIVGVSARPSGAEAVGDPVPALWEADVDAESSRELSLDDVFPGSL